MEKTLTAEVIDRIMSRAIEIHLECPDECRDFKIMSSPMREQALILQWLVIDISDIERPMQCFHYECFDMGGIPQNCSVNYASQKEANEFFQGLVTLYHQNFAHDHIFRQAI